MCSCSRIGITAGLSRIREMAALFSPTPTTFDILDEVTQPSDSWLSETA